MRNRISGYRLENCYAFVPFMRLEEEYPEETEIFNVEVEIAEASRKGERIEGLVQKRQHIIDSWIRRIENDLTRGYSDDRKKGLERELNRARQYENEGISHK